MVLADPNERLSIAAIKNHPWMKVKTPDHIKIAK